MAEYNIVITQRAFSDITECVLFVKNVSSEAANNLFNEIITKINSLKSFPNSYPEIEGLTIGGTKIRRMPIHNGRYLILYKVETDLVTIYDVVDSRKDNSILKI